MVTVQSVLNDLLWYVQCISCIFEMQFVAIKATKRSDFHLKIKM